MNIYTIIAAMFYMLAFTLLCITFSNIQATGAPVALILACLSAGGGAYFSICSMERRHANQ